MASLPPSLRLVLLVTAVLHGIGLGWGLPSSDSWDNDGVAPRDFLPGLAATFTPGEFYTYPPLHLALLAVLTAPVTLLAVARARGSGIEAIVTEIIEPPYMTAMSLTARVVTLLMSLGVLVALAKIADEIAERDARPRAGTFAALVFACDLAFAYYSHTSNLDVPALFWTSLAALSFTRAIARREPRRIRTTLVLAALATATKDQSYAVFLLGLPLGLFVWLALDPWARRGAHLRSIAKETAIGSALVIAILAVVDGAVFNPRGFALRLEFLRGPASQDFATYSKDAHGMLVIGLDLANQLTRHFPWRYLGWWWLVIVSGFVITILRTRGRDGNAKAAALVPLVLAISFTVCFTMVARRVEERFTLPQVAFLSIYGGRAFERACYGITSEGRGARIARLAGRSLSAFLIVRALFDTFELDVNLLHDPRYATEAFLAREARPSDTIEVHGLNVYLPRLPRHVRVARVGPTDPKRRGPIPGVEEIRAPLMDIERRKPRFVVVSECYVWRYLPRESASEAGRIVPLTQNRDASDADATEFFQSLRAGRLGYHVAHESRFESRIFARAFIHSSVGCPSTVFERDRSSP